MDPRRFAFLDSETGRASLRWLAVATSTAAVVCAAIVAVTLTGNPAPVPMAVAVLAIPILVAGQLATIAIVTRRSTDAERGSGASLALLRRRVFGDLPVLAVAVVAVCFYGAIILVMVSFASGMSGQPVEHDGGCRYGADNHGTITCLSEDEFDSARADWQRLFAGVPFAFFAVHTGVITSEIRSRRRGLAPEPPPRG